MTFDQPCFASLRATAVATCLMLAISGPALARRHGVHHGHGDHSMHAGASAVDRRHRDDADVKAASEEQDKLLDGKIKSICRGC
jgi:hypothetical protein